MRHRFVIFALIALGALCASVAARAEKVGKGDLRVGLDGSFTPRALPRLRPVPVTVDFVGAITTTDGRRPPPLRRFELDLNSHGRLSTRGLPTCRATELQSVSSQAALARCRPALVGHGHFRAEVESSEVTIPSSGRILVFNSRRADRPALLLHLYGVRPVRAAIVLPLAIRHRRGRELGTVLAARVPPLAGGRGSLTQIELTIGRRYRYRGRSRSYLSASCEAPAGLRLAFFRFARGSFFFGNGQKLRTTLTRYCRVHEAASGSGGRSG